jgi:serine/threonine protein kinase
MTARLATTGSPLPVSGGTKFLYPGGSRPLEGYTLKRGIGRGGFGEVYFAVSDAGKEVALKRIERNLEVELRGVSQCLNLKHPHLLALYDVRFDDQQDAWVVMEYVAGPTLKDVLDRHPHGLPLEQIAWWLRGMGAGLAYLHDQGIVHRDLKPGNVFDDGGLVKIGDYGLSKFISASRRSGQTESVGTFHYMAPEIGKGVYGKEIDIYALGVILYEMATGRPPFDGETSQEIIMKHLTAQADLTVVPAVLRPALTRALHKDPAQRFESVLAMLAALGLEPVGPGQRASLPAGWTSTPGSQPEGEAIPPQNSPSRKAESPQGHSAGSPADKPPHPTSVLDEEPVAQAVFAAARHVREAWRHLPLPRPLKGVMLAGGAVLVAIHLGWLVPLAVLVAVAYLAYLGTRWLVLALGFAPGLSRWPPRHAPPVWLAEAVDHKAAAPERPPPRGEPPPARGPASPVPGMPRPSPWRKASSEVETLRAALASRGLADHVRETTRALLWAALVAALTTVVLTALSGQALLRSEEPLAGPVWLWLVITLGSWEVLLLGRWWQRTDEERSVRLLHGLVAGLALGAMAWALSAWSLVQLSDSLATPSVVHPSWVAQMYDPAGRPELAAFASYFAVVFVSVHWWKHCDPLRRSRLHLGAVLWTVLAAWLWNMLWQFPQPWGFFVAGGVSVTTQLAAPWLSPAQRRALSQGIVPKELGR